MPLIVSPSAAALALPASSGSRAPARLTDQDTVKKGSFGEAMARSREAGRERAVELAIKPTPSKPVRRPADAEKSPVQDSVNPMAALLAAPLENRLNANTTAIRTATTAGAATSAGVAAIVTTTVVISGGAVDTAGPAESPGTQVALERADLLSTALAGLAPAGPSNASVTMAGSKDTEAALGQALAKETPSRQGVLVAANPGTQAAPERADLLPTATAGMDSAGLGNRGDAPVTVAGSDDSQAALGQALAKAKETPSRQGVLVAANTNPGTQALLGPALVVSASTSADPAQVLARTTSSRQAMPITTGLLAMAARVGAASAGLSELSAGLGDDGVKSKAAELDRRVELPPESADRILFSGAGGQTLPASAALQQLSNASVPNAPSPVTSALLLPDIGSSEWAKALGQQMIHLSMADRQVAELQLNPPGLGPLRVTLSMNDQQMQVAFVSTHSSVRAAVESALPQLHALLAESGISLGQTSVGSDSQDSQSQTAFTAFANGQNDSGSQSPRPGSQTKNAGVAALFAAQPVALQRRSSQGMRIDTYA